MSVDNDTINLRSRIIKKKTFNKCNVCFKQATDKLFLCDHVTHLKCYVKSHHGYDDTYYNYLKCLECNRNVLLQYRSEIINKSKKYKSNAWFMNKEQFTKKIDKSEKIMMENLNYAHCIKCQFWVEKESPEDCPHGICPVCRSDIYMYNN